MNFKQIICGLMMLLCSGASFLTKGENLFSDFASWCRAHNVADKLEAGVSVSSLGLGLDFSTPVTRWASLRAGVTWTPRMKVPMYFDLNTYADGMPTGNFDNVRDMLYNMTGIEMDERVGMKGSVSMVNFKLMVDVYPFQNNRHWHFTAGFFAGTSEIAKAYNNGDEKTTLAGINIYNRAYEYFTTLEDIFNVPLGGGVYMDWQDVLELQERFRRYGRMGIHVGDFKDGTPYLMEPAPDATISAKAFVNHFKPYLGAGYSTDLDKNGRWHFSAEIGAVFWGGSPKVINYDWKTGREVNFTTDLKNIRGKVGDYMKIVRGLPVYPLLEFRFSYSIF